MLRIAVAVLATLALLTSSADAKPKKPCVSHGREIRNLQHMTCSDAKDVANYFWSHAESLQGWNCARSKGLSLMRGYCEDTNGRRYFTWRPLD